MTENLRPIEILLVEDSPTDRLIAIEALREARIINNLNCVENGVDAMAYLRREGKYAAAVWPDLILLDLNLPKMDGRDVLVQIKNDPLLKFIPVVVLSTSASEEDLVSSYGHFASSFIRKPVDFPRFTNIVRSIGDYWFQVVALPPEEAVRRAWRAQSPQPPTPAVRVGQTVRTLLVEDSATDVILVRELLRESKTSAFEVHSVSRLSELRARSDLASFDLVLTDLGLPDSQGLETYRQVRSAVTGRPVIVLTGLDDEELGLRALREGAQDYLVKGDLTTRTLVRAIRYAVDRQSIEEQLRHSQRLEAIGRLAAGVAHDFNNILTVIQGQSEALEERAGLSGEMRRSLVDIQQAASRAATLTRQLLTFSRQQVMHTEPVILNDILGGVHRMLRRLLGAHVSIELQLAAAPTVVEADLGMIEQTIMNLAVNGRDAMPGGGKLTLSTAVVDIERDSLPATEAYPGRFVRLTVSDTGGGIDPAVLPHIFEPFFTTKDVGQGTGLGLATVYTVVQQHRGWIRVHSQLGAGTQFEIFLPLSTASPARRERSTTAAGGGHETILLVEDEPDVRRMTTMVLTRAGYQVLAAGSGAEAVRMWQERGADIDLLFTDIVMPEGLNGHELAALLCEQKKDIKVIYTSGYSGDFADPNTQLKEGVNFLQKPYSISSLTRVVRSCLDGAEPASGSSS